MDIRTCLLPVLEGGQPLVERWEQDWEGGEGMLGSKRVWWHGGVSRKVGEGRDSHKSFR